MLSWMLPTESTAPKKITERNRKIGFEDMKYAVQNNFLIINTLPESLQECLIRGTTISNEEEETMNELIDNDEMDRVVILYGANSADETVEKKFSEMTEMGFKRVYIYSGGLFEWLLLQDVFNDTEFPTTTKTMDLLAFQPVRRKFH